MSEARGLFERIESRYAQTRIRLEVPEWADGNGAPAVLYSRLFTAREEQDIAKHLTHGDDPAVWARLVHQKAEGENGERLFTGVDYPTFARRVEALVVKRIGMAILAGRVEREIARGN